MPDEQTLDLQAIDALRALSPEGGSDFLRELVEIYLQDTPLRLVELTDALARHDAPIVTRAAHTIKGSSGNFGAQRLSRLAQQIELHCKSDDLVAAAAVAPELRAEYERVAAALTRITAGT